MPGRPEETAGRVGRREEPEDGVPGGSEGAEDGGPGGSGGPLGYAVGLALVGSVGSFIIYYRYQI